MISAQSVTRTIGGFMLGPVSFDLEPGLVYALIGPNGSGKTTLFRLLVGYLRPDSGEIMRFGAPLLVDDQDQTRRLAYVPEVLNGHDSWPLSQVIEIYRRSYPSFDTARLYDYLDGIDRQKRFNRLSKGQQRRTMLALAMAAQTDVLLLDEPTDGIDPFARKDMQQAIAEYMDTGDRMAFIATHNLEDVRALADVILVLENGRQVGIWPKDDLTEGWQRLWLASAPPRALAGEVDRQTGAGIVVVTNDIAATQIDLANFGIGVVQRQAVEMVDSLRILIDRQSDTVP